MTTSLESKPVSDAVVQQTRFIQTSLPGPKSLALDAVRKANVGQGVTPLFPVYVARAGGGIIVDVDGNRLIDFASGIAVTGIGNASAPVVQAVHTQARKYTHTCFVLMPNEPYVRVAEALNRVTPGDHLKRTILVNSGAEAVENAVKIARAHTGRPAIVVFDHAFHGRTLLTMSMTSKVHPYKQGFGPFAPEIYRAPSPYAYRWPSGASDVGQEALGQFRDLVETQIGAENIAAVLIEPIQGEGGFIVPPAGFLSGLADVCKAHGLLLIVDEIQTGFGRTGTFFACEQEGVVPDLICTAKGIADGLPLAAVTGSADVMDSAPPGSLGGTYSGNPLACAAALEVIDLLENSNLIRQAHRIGALAFPFLRELSSNFPIIGDVRGRGAMIALEIVDPIDGAPRPDLTSQIIRRCHEQGVVLLSAGTYGNVVRMLPPFVIPPDLLMEGLKVVADAVEDAYSHQ